MDANDLHLASYERALGAKRRSPRTVQNYLEAVRQLAGHHGDADVMDLDKAQVEAYLLDVLGRHKPTTAANRFRSLRAFYNWAVDEEILDRSPMRKMSEPTITDVPPDVLTDEQLKALLRVCSGKDFDDRRDTAIIRLFCEPGSPRLAEMAGIRVDDVDLRSNSSSVRLLGKGDKIRFVPFGMKTGQALDRYLRLRLKHRHGRSPALWLGPKGPLTPSGITQMIRRRGRMAGIDHIHPHQFRHTAAHQWKLEGGSEEDAMALFGWSSAEMPRRYGRSASTERAHRAARRMSQADRL